MTTQEMVCAGAPSHAEVTWHGIRWTKCHREVRRLQARIVKATREGKHGKVRALQWTLTHSFSGKALGIVVKIVEPHGGVNAKGFAERASADNASAEAPPDYQPFVSRCAEAFARMSAARLIDSADVARVVHEAATDGTARLRYLVGNDTRGFIEARARLPDQEYVDFLRAHFRDAIGDSSRLSRG